MAVLLAIGNAAGQIVNDPMRPPSGYLEREATPDAVSTRALVLQSVKIAGADRSAIISGETVRQGDKVGSATVLKIDDGEVLLKDGDTEQVLKLYPAIDKRAVDKGKSAAKSDQRKGSAPSPRSGMVSGGGTR